MTVNDVPAACAMQTFEYTSRFSSQTPCAFSYSDALRPDVTAISPRSGTTGSLLTIIGSGLDASSAIEVAIGGRPCSITSMSATQLMCRVPALPAGSHVVSVRVPETGYSTSCMGCSNPLVFNSSLSVTGVSPSSGSLGGNTLLTISGSGFSSDLNSMFVTVGGVPCNLTFANLTAATCTTGSVATDLVATLEVRLTGFSMSATLSAAFTYANASTPKLASISPIRGSAGGGTVVTIAGELMAQSTDSVAYIKVCHILVLSHSSCCTYGLFGTIVTTFFFFLKYFKVTANQIQVYFQL